VLNPKRLVFLGQTVYHEVFELAHCQLLESELLEEGILNPFGDRELVDGVYVHLLVLVLLHQFEYIFDRLRGFDHEFVVVQAFLDILTEYKHWMRPLGFACTFAQVEFIKFSALLVFEFNGAANGRLEVVLLVAQAWVVFYQLLEILQKGVRIRLQSHENSFVQPECAESFDHVAHHGFLADFTQIVQVDFFVELVDDVLYDAVQFVGLRNELLFTLVALQNFLALLLQFVYFPLNARESVRDHKSGPRLFFEFTRVSWFLVHHHKVAVFVKVHEFGAAFYFAAFK